MSDQEQLASLLSELWPRFADDALTVSRLLEDTTCKVQRVNRTTGKNSFNELANTDAITIVTNHDRTGESVVMMPSAVLAALLAKVAEAAVKRATQSRPLMARLEGLQPLDDDYEGIQLRYDTRHRSHTLHVEDPQPEPQS